MKSNTLTPQSQPPPSVLLALMATDTGLRIANSIWFAVWSKPAPKGT